MIIKQATIGTVKTMKDKSTQVVLDISEINPVESSKLHSLNLTGEVGVFMFPMEMMSDVQDFIIEQAKG